MNELKCRPNGRKAGGGYDIGWLRIRAATAYHARATHTNRLTVEYAGFYIILTFRKLLSAKTIHLHKPSAGKDLLSSQTR
jgi:hypothetical protein